MGSSPIAPHSGSAVELRDRIEAERRAIPFLVFRDPEGRQSLHVLAPDTARVTIGRRPGNDVTLEWDTEVSRVHAALEPLGADWTITDDGISRNGTFVNGTRISGNPRLRDGDVIRVGKTTIVYRAPTESDSQATVAAGALPAVPELTATQRQVLVALCRPYKNAEFATPATNREIADEVHLSVDAVKAHLRALFARFGIEHLPQNQKRSRLVMEALQAGVVSTREL